ncbi:MAG: glutamate-cysteine ligase family protein [Candidatus Marsarchaeota archaeon]|nr:glutamate-cysteine ligase family protein [Candidatus Marsarchaeota archaeon]
MPPSERLLLSIPSPQNIVDSAASLISATQGQPAPQPAGQRIVSGKPRPMKRHMMGFETEMLLLEDNGIVSSRADELLETAQNAGLAFPVHHDYTHNMIEIASVANRKVTQGARVWLQTVQRLIEMADKTGLRIYPYGTYHGTHVPVARTDRYYRMCEDIMGPARYAHCTGHVCGFHLHYCLPYGTFNRNTRSIRHLFRSKYKDQFISLYNILIAMDPAVSNFMESSPFVDGQHMAKDARLFLYRAMRTGRGEEALRGLYYDQPMFGRLPRYSSSISDLILLVEQRYEAWKEMVGERHPEYLDIVQSRHPLQFNWGPLRINRVGTFEYRGMDMNLPTNMIGTSLLVKYMLKRVRSEQLDVRPSDIGIKEPFKIEGQTLHVPPYAYLSQVLQYKAALASLSDPEVYRYTKALHSMVAHEIPRQKDSGLLKIRQILQTRRTQSDVILEQARRLGWHDDELLDEEVARDMALADADGLRAEVARMLDTELAIDLEE